MAKTIIDIMDRNLTILKKESENRSYIHLKKFSKVLSSVGLEVLSSTSRQYFPFKLLYLGSIVNKLLEIIFYFH